MEIIRVGVDLAKNVFQLHGVDQHEKPVWKKGLRRGQWLQEPQRRVAPGGRDRDGGVRGGAPLGSAAPGARLSCEVQNFIEEIKRATRRDP